MLSRGKNPETNILVKLDEPLTSDGCLKVVTELLKYLLYNKQQIPFSYDSLMEIHAKNKPTDKNFLNMENFLNSVNDVTNHLSSQFYTEGCTVKEIVIIIGATIFSPKFSIQIKLPEKILDSKLHTEYHHSSRKPLLNLMRSMIESADFQDAITAPVGPTNTFVLVRKSDRNQLSKFFIPKHQYSFPSQSSYFNIQFDNNSETNCRCSSTINVFHDPRNEFIIDADNETFNKSNDRESSSLYQWYQSKQVIKGFKFLR